MDKIVQKIKNITKEDVLCLFIIISPILDMLSFIFRHSLDTSFSPSTFIRPIIPIIMVMIIFFQNKFKLKLFLGALFYGIYALIHILIFNNIKTESSYGGIINELQYIVNYSFMILNLFIYIYVFYKKDIHNKLKKSVLISLSIYIVSIFVAILTKTSSTTYIEGTGYKGWFESGNSLCAILCISLCIIISFIKDKKIKLIAIPVVILTGIFLTMLVGTRTGLFGFVLIIFAYVVSELFVAILKRVQVNIKLIISGLVVIVIFVSVVGFFGSKTLERREHLKNIEANIYDNSTGQVSHISGDLLRLKEKIEKNELSEDYMSKAAQQSIIDLYDYAEKTKMVNNDMRMQQLIYNLNLFKNQDSILLVLFGNGYKAQFRELVMEMEIPAFLLNFGIIGFILYFGPFLALFLYFIYFGIKNIRQIDSEYIILVFGLLLSFVLSFLSGYTFFYASASLLIIVICILVLNKINMLKLKQ